MIKKLFLTALLISVATCPSWAGKKLAELFIDAPIEQLQNISASQRLSLIIKHNNGEQHPTAESRLGEQCTLNAADSIYINISTSAAKRVEMRLFPKNKKDTMIAVIETIFAPAPDSRVACYDSKWKPLTTSKIIAEPQLQQFVAKGIPNDLKKALREAVPFSLVEMCFADNHTDIVARHSLKQFLIDNDYKRFAPYLKEQILFRFNGKNAFKAQ